MLNIYLTNLGKYNDGELIGEWVELPVSDEELQAVLHRIGISSEPDEHGNYYEETFITDYDCNIPGVEVHEYESIETLNELAEAIEDIDEDIAEALLSAGYDVEDIPRYANDCYFINVETDEEIGLYFAEEFGELSRIPDDLQIYFDFESYGRDIRINSNLYKTKNGYVEIVA